MPRIGRDLYHQAMLIIMGKTGYAYRDLGVGKMIVAKNERKGNYIHC